MTPSHTTTRLVIADDLTGACDAGVHFVRAGLSTRCVFLEADPTAAADIAVVTTESRLLRGDEAYARVRSSVERWLAAGAQLLYKKVDSTLRGQVGAEIDAVLDALTMSGAGRGVLVAPAFPEQGRTVVDGIIRVNDVPLAQTAAARDPVTPVTESRLRELLARQSRRPVAQVNLPAIRQPVDALGHALRNLLSDQAIIACDAEDENDLRRIVAAAQGLNPAPLLVGSAGLAHALAGWLGQDHTLEPHSALEAQPGPSRALIVCGSLHPVARQQLRAIKSRVRMVELDRARALIGGDSWQWWVQNLVGRLQRAPGQTTVLVTPTPVRNVALDAATTPGRVETASAVGRQLLQALAEAATAVMEQVSMSDVIIVGGETAGVLLRRWGAEGICLERELLPGAPVSTVAGGMFPGQRIVTKAGGFGNQTTMAAILDLIAGDRPAPQGLPADKPPVRVSVRADGQPSVAEKSDTRGPGSGGSSGPERGQPSRPAGFPNREPEEATPRRRSGLSERELPLLAVTMGDAAGVGPEIIVKALSRPEIRRLCRPLVIGDVAILRSCVPLARGPVRPAIVPVNSPDDALWADRSAIYVLQPGAALEGVMPGQLSAVAGRAAVNYVLQAVALAQNGAVSGIVTAPLNKEAIHRAGYAFPGHTELLATQFGVQAYSLVLAARGQFIFHVTTHVSLRQALDLITFGRVLGQIRLAHLLAKALGQPGDTIAVAGVNPHAGESGLFGDEEQRVIAPAVAAAQAQGIPAVGPLAADVLFPRAAAGQYHYVIAMYHDQGHAVFKTLYFDEGVNVTVGLPVIRTSVDHGTAFDIAGRGVARDQSLVEAIQLAARLGPKWGPIAEEARRTIDV